MQNLDQAIFRSIFDFNRSNLWLGNIAVIMAEYLPYLLVLGFFALVLDYAKGRMRIFHIIQVSLILILSRGIVTEIIRYFLPRLRPFAKLSFEPLVVGEPAMNSFPSGHAAFFFALAVAVWAINRGWGVAYFTAAIVNGLSRVYAGVHWPGDILGGAVIGILSGWAILKLLEPYHRALRQTAAFQEPVPETPENIAPDNIDRV